MQSDPQKLNGSGRRGTLREPKGTDKQALDRVLAVSRETRYRSGQEDLKSSLSAPVVVARAPKGQLEASAPKGIIDAFLKTCHRWRLEDDQPLTLLGFKQGSILGHRALAGQMAPLSQDLEDRVGYVVGISLGLGALFGESVEAENDWLRRPRNELHGKSALDFMLEGRMANLIAVSQLLHRERGL